jgi:hypothetical protein
MGRVYTYNMQYVFVRYEYKILAGKRERKRPFWRLRLRREDNIQMDLKEMGCVVVEWIRVSQNKDQSQAPVNTIMSLRVP